MTPPSDDAPPAAPGSPAAGAADRPLGAILAGGRSTRYGAPKALAEVDGVPIVERVRRALAPVAAGPVLIANEPALYAPLGLPQRPDARPGLGPLGGIHAALLWARERGDPGALVVACDMPFVPVALLAHLTALARAGDADVVLPESGSRRGLEPLCAWYSARCLPAIEARADAEDLRMIGFHDLVRVRALPLAEVAAHGDPEVLFMNVNRPEERVRADALARGGAP